MSHVLRQSESQQFRDHPVLRLHGHCIEFVDDLLQLFSIRCRDFRCPQRCDPPGVRQFQKLCPCRTGFELLQFLFEQVDRQCQLLSLPLNRGNEQLTQSGLRRSETPQPADLLILRIRPDPAVNLQDVCEFTSLLPADQRLVGITEISRGIWRQWSEIRRRNETP